MRHVLLSLAALSLAVPVAVAPLPSSEASAQTARNYRGTTRRHYYACRKSKGTTGLIVGGAAGALVGGAVTDGIAGPIIGGVAGALGGRAIDRASTRHKRCRSYRR